MSKLNANSSDFKTSNKNILRNLKADLSSLNNVKNSDMLILTDDCICNTSFSEENMNREFINEYDSYKNSTM
jgi:hypothetical protein